MASCPPAFITRISVLLNQAGENMAEKPVGFAHFLQLYHLTLAVSPHRSPEGLADTMQGWTEPSLRKKPVKMLPKAQRIQSWSSCMKERLFNFNQELKKKFWKTAVTL